MVYNFAMSHSKYDPERHHRRSIRLAGYDYSQPGGYFVTILSAARENIFGDVMDDTVVLSPVGQIVANLLLSLPRIFPVQVESWIVMPNHVHAIFLIYDAPAGSCKGEAAGEMPPDHAEKNFPAASPASPADTQRRSLGAIVQYLKSTSARRINLLRKSPGAPVWHRNYYERVLRDEQELQLARGYIRDNPRRWFEE